MESIRSRAREAVVCALCLAAAAVFLAAHTARFFPTERGELGHDYGYFLPQLVVNLNWYHVNGFAALPYFTPAFCGGVPLLGNPQSLVFSVPQLLTAAMDPISAMHVTLLIFAGLGAVACFALLVECFGVSIPAATLGSVLFLLNGFVSYRLIIGHATYHAFGLVPLMAWIILRPFGEAPASRRMPILQPLVRVALGGCVLAYVVFGGGLNFAIPIVLTLACTILVWQQFHSRRLMPWILLAGICVWAVAVAAIKIAPAAVLASQFPREHIPENLFRDPKAFVRSLLAGLFLPGALREAESLGRGRGNLNMHELEYGLSLVPLILVSGAVLTVGARRLWTARRAGWQVLAAVLVTPLLLTFGSWRWGLMLQDVPILQNNTTFVRWWAMYILPIIIVTALSFDRIIRVPSLRTALLVGCVLLIVVQEARRDMSYYSHNARFTPYDPAPVMDAYRALREGQPLPPIATVGRWANPDVSPMIFNFNNAFLTGSSSWPCYEPLFGYQLELLPDIGLGPSDSMTGGRPGSLALVDPASYFRRPPRPELFPADRLREVEAFAAYRPLAWTPPGWQVWANRVSLTSIVISGLVALGAAFQAARDAIARRSPR